MEARIEPRQLLERLLKLIEKDVEQIEKLSVDKLEHSVTLDLTRYTGCLLDIVKALDSADAEGRKRAAEMSTDELVRLAEQSISQLKSK